MARATCAMVLGLLLAFSVLPSADTSSVVVNFNRAGGQVVRFDVRSNAVDAHDGEIRFFGDAYYLYGTSYDCGYQWLYNGPFCGFKVYSSTDLIHWVDRGFLFDVAASPWGASPWQARCSGSTSYGCYRPHVVYNQRTGRYVLWINDYSTPVNFRVLESAQPTGPFVEVSLPVLAINQGRSSGVTNGDENLFVDADGTAYIVYTDWVAGGDIVVEKLDARYGSGTGQYARVGLVSTEAPSLFKRGGLYYLTYSDPNCGYCATGTSYKTASSPLGPWSAAVKFTTDSCGGQPAHVAEVSTPAGPLYMYQSDLWHDRFHNQGPANYFWAPLGFNADGSVQPLSCVGSFPLTLSGGTPGRQQPSANLDQWDGVDGFSSWCDIGGYATLTQRVQTFVPARTGVLSGLSVTTFQGGSLAGGGVPDADLFIDVVDVDGSGRPLEILSRSVVAASTIGYSPRNVTVQPGIQVIDGKRYGIHVHSPTTQGCYGMAYSDDAPYAPGQEYYSLWNSGSFTLEANRSLKFETAVVAGPVAIDQHNGAAAFSNYSDVFASVWRLQTFRLSSTTLARADLWTYRAGNPTDALTMRIVALDERDNPAAILYETTVAVPATPGWVTIYPNLTDLAAGRHYGIQWLAPRIFDNTSGAYGWAYNDANVYPDGVERYSYDSGTTWTTETGRSVKFIVYNAGM